MSREGWTFLTNHGHVYLSLARNPSWRLRDVAAHLDITERAVQKIITELVEQGYLEKERLGRRNEYRVVPGRPLRHRSERHLKLDHLIDLLLLGDQGSDELEPRLSAGFHRQAPPSPDREGQAL